MTMNEYLNHDGSHIALTCENHPNLRWSCKSIATYIDDGGIIRYNGIRNIFFSSNWGNSSEYVSECDCPASKLYVIIDAD